MQLGQFLLHWFSVDADHPIPANLPEGCLQFADSFRISHPGSIVMPEQKLPAVQNTLPQVKAIYPSFDVVPPHLISGVVTDKGVYVPYLLNKYFETEVKKFY